MSRSAGAALALVAALLLSPSGARAGSGEPDDPVFRQGLQWSLDRTGVPTAWAASRGAGTTIAIVDSGADLAHEDLAGKVVAQVSCIGADGDPARCSGRGQDDNGHGTHVSAIAAATTGNGRGIAGVAPDARLMIVKVLSSPCDDGDCSATGEASDVAAGVRWAADRGADVINLSLGGGPVQGVLGCAFCDAVEYAWAKGSVPVIAAGNDSGLPAGFSDEHAVIVTATTRDDARASYSNASSGLLRSARWPVAAPGGEGEARPEDCATGGQPRGVLSAYWVPGQRNAYACLAGTSMAAPHVSGALALLLAQGRTPQQAVDRLLATAVDLGPPGRDDQFGMGRIDVARAVGSAPSPPTSAPAATTTAPPTTPTTVASAGQPGSGTVPPADEPVTVPGLEEAAPFVDPAANDAPAGEAPPWLVTLAVAAIVLSGGAAAVVTWRLAEREPR